MVYTGRLQVTLFVRDLPVSVDFYQRVLGFSFKGYWDRGAGRFVDALTDSPQRAELQAGENRIVLCAANGDRSPGAAVHTLAVDDLDLLYRRVKSVGSKVVAPKVETTGERSFTLTDADGHLWSFLQA